MWINYLIITTDTSVELPIDFINTPSQGVEFGSDFYSLMGIIVTAVLSIVSFSVKHMLSNSGKLKSGILEERIQTLSQDNTSVKDELKSLKERYHNIKRDYTILRRQSRELQDDYEDCVRDINNYIQHLERNLEILTDTIEDDSVNCRIALSNLNYSVSLIKNLASVDIKKIAPQPEELPFNEYLN